MKFTVRASLIALAVGLVAPAAFGAPVDNITIQGRIVNPAGNPVTGASTKFRVQLLTPDASKCVLYDETRAVDLSNSAGLFSINLADGGGTRNAPLDYTLDQALSNRVNLRVDGAYCFGPGATPGTDITFSPLPKHNRRIVIQFNDPSSMGSSWETIPEMSLNPVPYAIDSRSVGGYEASAFLKVVDAGVPGAPAALTASNFTELMKLVNGTSENYMSAASSSTNGARLPTYSGNPGSPAAGSIWFDSASNTIKYSTGSGAPLTIGASSGGSSAVITSVSGGDGISVSGTSAISVSLSPSGVGADGSVGSATSIPEIQYDTYGRIKAVTSHAISGVLPAAGADHQVLKSTSGSWGPSFVGFADLRKDAGTPLFPNVCATNRTYKWDSITGVFQCVELEGITSSQLADLSPAVGGSYRSVTVNTKGQVTSGSNPTTIAGYGLTDAVQNGGAVPRITSGNADPVAAGADGEIYVAVDSQKIYRYQSAAPAGWRTIATAGGASGTITDVNAGSGISVAGSGATRTISLDTAGMAAVTNATKITTDSYGRVTAGGSLAASDIPTLSWSKIDSATKPTDLAGYGITNGVQNGGSVPKISSGAALPTLPTGTIDGELFVGTDTQKIYRYTAGSPGSWAEIAAANSSASVGANAPLSNSGGTISISQAGASSAGYLSSTDWNAFNAKLGTVLNAARLWVGNASNVATAVSPGGDVSMDNAGAFTVNRIRGTSVSASPSATGQTLRFDGTSYTPSFVAIADLRSKVTGTSAISATCTASQTLSWDSVTDNLSCQNISIAASTQITGILPVSRGGTGVDTAPQGHVFAGPSSGAGAPAFRALTAADLPSSASLWAESSGNVYRNSGNVGIGTTAPEQALHLKGSGLINEVGAQPNLTLRRANGVAASPTAILAGDIVSQLVSSGYDSSAYKDSAIIRASATENWTTSANGTSLSFLVTKTGSSIRSTAMVIDGAGNVGIGTTNPTVSLDISARTDALRVPNGTSAQQPGQASMPAAANGMIRYNTTTNQLEARVNNAWTNLATVGGTQSFSGNVNVGGTLTSTGAATFNAGATIAGGALQMSSGSITGVGSDITGTGALTVAAGGSNQNLTLRSSGAGAVNLGSPNGTSLSVLDGGASTVNYVTVKGAATGASPVLGTAGADANINLVLTPKGTGRVGIGTTGPSANLHVNSAQTNGGNFGAGQAASGGVLVANASTSASSATIAGLTIASGGLGTSSAHGWQFNLIGVNTYYDPATDTLKRNSVNGGFSDTQAITMSSDSANHQGGNRISFWTGASADPSERMVITRSGNVGAGTTAPLSRLHVHSGALRVSTGAGAGGTWTTNGDDIFLNAGSNASSITARPNGDASTVSQLVLNTVNGLQYFGSAGTEIFRVSSAGNVGIGTVTPTNMLDVVKTQASPTAIGVTNLDTGASSSAAVGVTTDSAAAQLAAWGSGQAAGTYNRPGGVSLFTSTGSAGGLSLAARNAAGVVTLHTGGSAERMRIDAAGNVGIGTSSPLSKLHVSNAGSADFLISNTNQSSTIQMRTDTAGTAYINNMNNFTSNGSTGNGALTLTGQTGIRFNYGNSGASGTTAAVIDPAGNVGIGTSTPRGKLNVNGNVYIDNIGFGGNPTISLAVGDTDTGLNSTADGQLDLQSNNVRTMSLRNGKVGIMTTVPSTELDVLGVATVRGASGALQLLDRSTANGTILYRDADIFRIWGTGVGDRLSIDQSGNTTITGALTQNSDRRLKEDIEPVTNALAKLARIQGVTYRWKNPKMEQRRQLGVIAQDVEAVFPEAVRNSENGTLSVSYPNLVAPIITALHEIKEWMQGSDARLAKIVAENARLRAADEAKARELASLKARMERLEKLLDKR